MRPRYLLSIGGMLSLSCAGLAQLKLQDYVTGLSAPVAMIQDPSAPNVQYVLQQRGRLRPIINGVLSGTDALDLTGIVSTSGSERGLLGLAFHPQYPVQPYIYVNFTNQQSGNHPTRVVRYTRNAITPTLFDVGTAQNVITIAQDFTNHNGGTIQFGPDGYLYIGMGDGGSGNDPNNRAQSFTSLLGKLLRVNVNADDFPGDATKNYGIPPGQPITVTGGTLAPEIWAFGLRNPWKWTFDNPAFLGTGGIYIGDVGQNEWEEINYEPPATPGRNYGWRPREGNVSTGLSGGPNSNYKSPIWVYPRADGFSVTGGYVYRGTLLGDFFGRYFFADYGSQKVWSFVPTFDGSGEANVVSSVTDHTVDLQIGGIFATQGLSAFAVNATGELFLIDYGTGPSTTAGRVLRVLPENRFWLTEVTPLQTIASSGQLRSILADDNHSITVEPSYEFDSTFGDNSVLRVRALADFSPANVSVRVRGRSNQPGGQQIRVGFRNWSNGRIQWVQTITMPFTTSTITTTPVAAANFRRPSDGRYEVFLSAVTFGAAVDPVLTTYDSIKLQ